MMVHPRHTCLAYAAMLASRWLQEFARPAGRAWIVQHPVVRVVSHLLGMIERGDVCLAVAFRAEIQEDVWLWQQDEG